VAGSFQLDGLKLDGFKPLVAEYSFASHPPKREIESNQIKEKKRGKS
jgi:hypothetical protein